jgi:hypothetical protein
VRHLMAPLQALYAGFAILAVQESSCLLKRHLRAGAIVAYLYNKLSYRKNMWQHRFTKNVAHELLGADLYSFEAPVKYVGSRTKVATLNSDIDTRTCEQEQNSVSDFGF